MNDFKLINQVVDFIDPLEVAENFADQSGTVFLDSVVPYGVEKNKVEYCFLAVDPFASIKAKKRKIIFIEHVKNKQTVIEHDPWLFLQDKLQRYRLPDDNNLPPFIGGAAGFWGYELNQHLEKSLNGGDDFIDMFIGLYDLVISFNLSNKKMLVHSSGYPNLESKQRKLYAQERLNKLLRLLQIDKKSEKSFKKVENLESNFSQDEYEDKVNAAQKYIRQGDIFEVNISQQFSAHLSGEVNYFTLYKELRKSSPAPFAAFISMGDKAIISASPERFLHLQDNTVTTCPIKGTIARGVNKKEDDSLKQQLTNSLKDHAENIMIVDLMRNDLSKVCLANTVLVEELCSLKTFSNVHHLVSVIKGSLNLEKSALDLLMACFPGGSITGAPKIRSMEIIQEIEKSSRGPYCGSIGYIGFNGNMDTSIIIRTIVVDGKTLKFNVGGAITLDSNPTDEFQETLAKAQGILKSLGIVRKNKKPIARGMQKISPYMKKIKKQITLQKPIKALHTKKILLIDNYDSFVHNLARYVSELGHEPLVYRNDQITINQIQDIAPQAIIISPGPCSPQEAGVSMSVVREFCQHLPILGVCLGHQVIAQAFGGIISKAKFPLHGMASEVYSSTSKIFTGLPEVFHAARYHSLIVEQKELPQSLNVTAYSKEKEIMALEHKVYPTFGIQFHLESILTEIGYRLLNNFLKT